LAKFDWHTRENICFGNWEAINNKYDFKKSYVLQIKGE
jgi:hypothetical protein